jgi:hypothetical protein
MVNMKAWVCVQTDFALWAHKFGSQFISWACHAMLGSVAFLVHTFIFLGSNLQGCSVEFNM